ncbi:hypothetical protein WJX74_003893 [Apatococcus lobatus]|uniref:50S ribosomal protein L35 n=2 Tax=Apatococcus TaxID=904362 RepID=A0AAW1SPN4_9CHLO
MQRALGRLFSLKAATSFPPPAAAVSALSKGTASLDDSAWLSSPTLQPKWKVAARQTARGFADKSWDVIQPAKTKLKLYSSYKERFKMTGSGKIRAMRPGHRHKRFVKSNNQNRALRKTKLVHHAYAQTMKKLGFRMRSFA